VPPRPSMTAVLPMATAAPAMVFLRFMGGKVSQRGCRVQAP
jgi:hypothetical protein